MGTRDSDYFADMTISWVVALFFIWIVSLVIAAYVAPPDRTWTFVGLTVAFGPLGILAAAVASPRNPEWFFREPRSIAKGRTRCRCARCGAESDLAQPQTFACWRCSEKAYIAVK
jgi:hypothetical protein